MENVTFLTVTGVKLVGRIVKREWVECGPQAKAEFLTVVTPDGRSFTVDPIACPMPMVVDEGW